MTFSETIDALIPIYEEGMKAESYEDLEYLNLYSGICWVAALRFDFNIGRMRICLKKYGNANRHFYPIASVMKSRNITQIIEMCIRPRLELLKRIQKDLQTKES